MVAANHALVNSIFTFKHFYLVKIPYQYLLKPRLYYNRTRGGTTKSISKPKLFCVCVCVRVFWQEPTPIQRQAIPIGLQNRDIIGVAETGQCCLIIYFSIYPITK